jgi:tRNA G46 methylase TrmB
VAIDLGTGDGRFVLAAAAARPDTLVIGLDADAAAMADASRRAARRGAIPNALFAVAAAEHPP